MYKKKGIITIFEEQNTNERKRTDRQYVFHANRGREVRTRMHGEFGPWRLRCVVEVGQRVELVAQVAKERRNLNHRKIGDTVNFNHWIDHGKNTASAPSEPLLAVRAHASHPSLRLKSDLFMFLL